jgi:protease IV
MGWVLFVVRWLGWGVRRLRARWGRVSPYVSFLIEGPEPALPAPPGPRWRRWVTPQRRSVHELAEQLRIAAADPRVRGVVLHLRAAAHSDAQAESLAGLIAEVRRSGTRVLCWASSYTSSTYRIACAADEVLLQPGGEVGVLGNSRAYVYLAESLGRAGVEADVLQVSPYKTAGDTLSRATMSDAAREMANWLADAQQEELVTAIAEGRGTAIDRARELIDAAPLTDRAALQHGLIDAVLAEDELPARTQAAVVPWHEVRRRLRRPPPRPPRRRYVGIIRVEGLIVDGRTRRPPLPTPPVPPPFALLFQEQTGDLSIVQQARRLAKDRRAAAVVLWIDSGGGSATSSEAMHAALRELAARKPLVAAMGSVAGSGGYYVATAARRIFAQPGTWTGSIGVLTAKLVTSGLMDRLLVGREVVQRGAFAGIGSPERRWDDAERAKVRASVDRIYELFLERVTAARGRPREALEPIAGGRVWTGRQALQHGLVDELGDLDRALAAARKLAGLPADAPIRELPAGPDAAPLAPTPAPAAAALQHALATLQMFERAGVWLLAPLLPPR